jgi:hypothetical protein
MSKVIVLYYKKGFNATCEGYCEAAACTCNYGFTYTYLWKNVRSISDGGWIGMNTEHSIFVGKENLAMFQKKQREWLNSE